MLQEELSTSVVDPHFDINGTVSTDCDIHVVYEKIRKEVSMYNATNSNPAICNLFQIHPDFTRFFFM